MALRVESLAMRRLAVAATVVALVRPCAAAPPRFFVEGPGTLAIENAHTGERAAVVYRRRRHLRSRRARPPGARLSQRRRPRDADRAQARRGAGSAPGTERHAAARADVGLPQPRLQRGAARPGPAGRGRLAAHRGPGRRPRLSPPRALRALAARAGARLLRRGLLRPRRVPPRRRRPAAVLGGRDLARRREPLRRQ